MAQVLRFLPKINDPNLLVGTETHDDAGVYRLTDDLAIVQTLDFFPPVVDDPFVFGQIAAANALSDIYAMGGMPKTALNLVGFPDDKESLDWLGEILRGGAERCQAAGAVVIGGHSVRDTEIKFGLAATGIIDPRRILTNASARPGDKLVLTKGLGTGFITTANKAGACPEEVLAAACTSMIQLNDVGRDVMIEFRASAATDVTGFGLAGHAYEMAEGSGVTLAFELSRLPLLEGAQQLARKPFITRASATNAGYVAPSLKIEGKPDATRLEFFYDAQTSGGMLISVPAERAEALAVAARQGGAVQTAIIGEVIERQDNIALIVHE
jgi:selenide,water dikinase